MNKIKKESFFWTSYSDLMTSLFFIMLVLFILTIAMLHSKIKATEYQLNKIKEIEESIKNINSKYFEYDAVYKRHTLKNISVSFTKYSFNMNDIDSNQKRKLLEVGMSIKSFVDSTVTKNPNIKYLLIIEGQSSKDDYFRDDYFNNDVLSFQRAYSLFRFWKSNGIILDDNSCEAIISGSGQNSNFRMQPDDKNNRGNQRFVLHIIPKPGIIDFNSTN